MRLIALFIVCLAALSSPLSMSATTYLKIGNFDIDSFCHGGFLLDDGRVYIPISPKQKKQTQDWQLGDPMLVMQKKHGSHYIVVNTRTGELAKMKVKSIEKCF